jgi:hypothetical protein
MKIYIKVSTTTKDFAMKNSNWRLVWQFTITPRMPKALRQDISMLKVGQICSDPPPGFAICDLGWVLGVFHCPHIQKPAPGLTYPLVHIVHIIIIIT